VDSPSLSLRSFLVYGLLGGIFATIITFIATSFLGLPYPPEAIFQLMISLVPGSVQSVAVETFGEYAKYGAFTFSAAIYATMYAFVAVLAGFLFRKELASKSLYALVFATAIPTTIGLGLQWLLSPRTSILSVLFGWLIASTLTIGVNFAYAAIVIYPALAQLDTAIALTAAEGEGARTRLASRRGFLKKVTVAAAVLAVAGFLSQIGLSLFSGQPVVRTNTPIPINNPPAATGLTFLPAIFRDPRISDLVGSEVTDNRIFYRVDIDPIPPQLDFDQWTLKISGKVNNPYSLDKSGLMALPTIDEYAALECVSNTINPPSALISNAKWTGVPLGTILNQAGIPAEAKYVVFHCADGYSVGIPLNRAMKPEALMAYKMNDQVLSNGHGFPLRAIVPGIYGMMNAKWITEIEVVDHVYFGFWQERGWSNDAKIKTTSIIYYPPSDANVHGPIPIAGVAFAGDRGISRVEVSVDGGGTWNEALLKPPHSPYSWVLWAYQWTPTNIGPYRILARAYDGTGKAQDPTAMPPFPEGASGYNIIEVNVT